jgi:cilla- and flagella-associated protein
LRTIILNKYLHFLIIRQDYYQGGNHPPSHYRHSQSDLTGAAEWEEGHQNGNRDYPQRRGVMSNGGSQDRYPADERREFYPYRNGNVSHSREDFGEEIRRGRSENTVISNAVLSHLAGMHRRPVNRVI